MNILTAFVLIGFVSHGAQACQHDLAGTWKSDKEASMAFARDHTKLEPRTETFLAALFGHMTLTFDGSELHIVMPDIEVPVSGNTTPFAGFEARKPYSVLFCNEFSVVISAEQPAGAGLAATTFNFVDRDTYWVYAGGTNPNLPDLHTREFFRRVR